jgi:peroxin-12
MTTVSGYAFCYPCIFTHVQQHGRCPVTHIPATVDSIRRLYQST